MRALMPMIKAANNADLSKSGSKYIRTYKLI